MRTILSDAPRMGRHLRVRPPVRSRRNARVGAGSTTRRHPVPRAESDIFDARAPDQSSKAAIDGEPRPRGLSASVALELVKPRIVVMNLVATATGFRFGAVGLEPLAALWLLIQALVGTAFVAAGALCLNQVVERDLDARMARTRMRPLPAGRVTTRVAATWGLVLLTAGTLFLLVAVNAWIAALGLLSAATYVLVYTPLKRRTWLNTFAGAVPGAIPPLMGWAAASGDLPWESLLLFAVLFAWQIPHFLAIAVLHREDYARAGFRMLTTVDDPGMAKTRAVALVFAALFALAAPLPLVARDAPLWASAAALVAGACMIPAAWRMAREPSRANARALLIASVIGLPLVLALLAGAA